MPVFYFAYGSNMLPSRLGARCPSAQVFGVAEAVGHGLNFAKRGSDGSGKATLYPDAALRTWGVLFTLEPGDIEPLDRAEGAGKGYDRIDDFSVETADGQISAITYIAPVLHHDQIPYDWYLALVIAGARANGLPYDHFKSVTTKPDPVPDRPGRQEALRALRQK